MPDSTRVLRYGHENVSREEEPADGSLTAGDIVEETTNGFSAISSSAAYLDRVLVALDRRGLGHEAGDTIEDNDVVVAADANAGVGVHLRVAGGGNLGTASEANISEGDRLVTAGGTTAGTVRKFDSANDSDTDVIAVAEEAVDNSGASSPALVAAEVTR